MRSTATIDTLELAGAASGRTPFECVLRVHLEFTDDTTTWEDDLLLTARSPRKGEPPLTAQTPRWQDRALILATWEPERAVDAVERLRQSAPTDSWDAFRDHFLQFLDPEPLPDEIE
jgi:hypothetical protein